MTESEHVESLIESARAALELDDAERIRFALQDKWIPYPRAEAILKRMEELFAHPPVQRMPNLLLYGDSNIGKTAIVRQFQRMHPRTDGVDADAYPVVIAQAPPGPDERRFLDDILGLLRIPFRYRDELAVKQGRIKNIFGKIGTRMLIVDEFHNVLSGTVPKQRHFLNCLKNFSNDWGIVMVLVGTKDALIATNTDPQIQSRYPPMGLPKWEMDEAYAAHLAGVEKTLPLKKPSCLASREIGVKIMELAEGNLGDVMELISKACRIAIETGTERISMNEILAVGHVPPSKR